MKNIKSLLVLLLTISLSIFAYVLSIYNSDFMLPGNRFLFIFLFIAILFIVIFTIYINKKKVFYDNFYLILIVIFAIATLNNIISLNISQYNYSKNASSTLDYFLKSGGRNMERIEIDYGNYLGNFQPIAFDLFKNKELYVDSEIVNDNLIKIVEGLEWKVCDLSVTEDYSIEHFQEIQKPQIIKIYDIEKNEKKLLIFTGDQFEKADKLFISKIDNSICIFSEDMINIEYHLTELYSQKQFSEDIYETVILELHNDSTITRIRDIDNNIKMMIFLLSLCIIGFLFFYPLIRKNIVSLNLSLLLSFIIGSIFQIFIIMILGLAGIPINSVNIIIVNVVLILIWFLISNKLEKGVLEKPTTKYTIFILLFIIGIIVYFSIKPHVYMSFDSYTNIYIGKKIAYTNQIRNDLSTLLMFSLISTNWQALASLFDISFNNAMQPAFTTLGLAALFYLQNDILENKGVNRNNRIMISIISLSSITLLPQTFINSTWILNNLVIGISYGIAIAMLLRYNQNNNKLYVLISYLIFIFTGIARIEGGLFAIFYLMFIYKSNIQEKLRKILISGFTLIYATLFICYLNMVKHISEGFWTTQNAALALGLLLCFNMFVLLDGLVKIKFRKVVENIDYLMILSIMFGGVILSIINPAKALINIQNLTMNIVSTGYYGIFFPCILLAISIYLIVYKKISKGMRMLLIPCASYILLIFVLMLISKHNSRVGYGDSSCRMVLHILPVFGLLLSNILAEIYDISKFKKGV